MIVHINGWPGVGKQTVGRIVARKLGARFIHNHLLHDVAICCTGLNDPDRWTLYEDVRNAAYAALSRRPRGELFVMTNALCTHSSREQSAWRHVVELAKIRGVPLIPIVLEASIEEIERRLQSPDRVGKKLIDPELLREFLRTDTIHRPAIPELLVINTTGLAAEQTADRIIVHLRNIESCLSYTC